VINQKAVVEVVQRAGRQAKKYTGQKEMIGLVGKLKKVKANQSYTKTITAIEEELRWRFGKDY